MGFFDKLLHSKVPESVAVQNAPLTVCAPFSGTAMKMEDIPDPVFSQGVLGTGCGIDPAEEIVYAPFNGTVSQTTDTLHAIGVTSEDGIELLIHVGMDTVEMAGKGFKCLVKKDQAVTAGQPLMTFTLSDIQSAGHPPVTAVVVTNADDFAGVELLADGRVELGAPLLRVTK